MDDVVAFLTEVGVVGPVGEQLAKLAGDISVLDPYCVHVGVLWMDDHFVRIAPISTFSTMEAIFYWSVIDFIRTLRCGCDTLIFERYNMR